MSNTDINIKAYNFSPLFWWRAIGKAIDLTHAFGEELNPGFSFKKWFHQESIEHDSLEINIEPVFGTDSEYKEAIRNDYFSKVLGISAYGHKVSEKTFDDLHRKHKIDTEKPITYLFSIYDMNHFISSYIQQWLIYDTFFCWVRWQLYFDFIVSKLDTPRKELFMYMWSIIFHEIEFEHKLFNSIDQYKKFRDKLDEINEHADFVESKIKELRNATT